MQLISVNVKGTMEEAQAELTKRNIVFKFGRSFDADTITRLRRTDKLSS